MIRKIAWALGACLALVLLRFCTIAVPVTPEQPALRSVRGAMHVHTSRSHDGKQSLAEVTRDAKRAGLDFIIVTDHNAAQDGPSYSAEGVLVVPAVELSMKAGHVIALGPDEKAIEGFAGRLDDLAFGDVWQQSKLVIGGHPDSQKQPMSDADVALAGGYELLSTSADFYRVLGTPSVAWLLGYPLRPRVALQALYPDRAPGSARYDAMPAKPLLACGVDDHGLIGAEERLLTYVTYLPTFIPERDATKDAATVIDLLALRQSYCALGLYGDASPFSVTVRAGELATIGSEVSAPAKLRLRWQAPLPAGHRFYIYKDGAEVASSSEAALEFSLEAAGRYRVEVGRDVPTFFFGTRHVRWIYTSPIIVLPSAA